MHAKFETDENNNFKPKMMDLSVVSDRARGKIGKNVIDISKWGPQKIVISPPDSKYAGSTVDVDIEFIKLPDKEAKYNFD